jgi:hypothetical protein
MLDLAGFEILQQTAVEIGSQTFNQVPAFTTVWSPSEGAYTLQVPSQPGDLFAAIMSVSVYAPSKGAFLGRDLPALNGTLSASSAQGIGQLTEIGRRPAATGAPEPEWVTAFGLSPSDAAPYAGS